ncbi:aminoacyl-tRNA hydrolase [Actinomycetaceae bacterium TAE3-ERU4]|nr:aminoacyl-tRNA hydrolase [Actinomycetaceae bacterium TAE3-ERU4]
MNSPWLIVGLGNPGPKYQRNRHNVGQMVADALVDMMNASYTRHRAGALVADGRLGVLPGGIPGPRVLVAKLDCYMNVSGRPLAALAKFYNVNAQRILVVHDELDIPEHTLRLKTGGGEGGHNGLRSITQCLGTKNYHRLRVGIGRPPGQMDTADFVLSDLPKRDIEDWALTVVNAAQAACEVVTDGFTTAQQRLHSHS